MTLFAVYRGDTHIVTGTSYQVAAHMGWKVETVSWYTNPSYMKRVAKRKNARNYITVSKL